MRRAAVLAHSKDHRTDRAGSVHVGSGGADPGTADIARTRQCMQERAGFALNCTANDVSVAGVHRLSNGAYDITITDPCSRAGDDVTFTARFDVVLTAQERHDIGIYFATDGDANGDGALTSDNQAEKKGCSVTTLEWQSGFGGVDLDGTDDPSGHEEVLGHPGHVRRHQRRREPAEAAHHGDGQVHRRRRRRIPRPAELRQLAPVRRQRAVHSPADTFPGRLEVQVRRWFRRAGAGARECLRAEESEARGRRRRPRTANSPRSTSRVAWWTSRSCSRWMAQPIRRT